MSDAPGNWGRPEVPKHGWTCVEVFDSLEYDERDDNGEYVLTCICEMCEAKLIRYVHVMTHDDWPIPIEAGCVCAGKMEGDGAAAAKREALAKRRVNFHAHSRWTETDKGARLNIDGYMLVAYQQGPRWKVLIRHRASGRTIYGRNEYPDETAARQASLDALIYAKQRETRT